MRPGAEAFVDGLCGCQFALRPIRVRLIKVLGEASIGPGLVWVHVYQLTYSGEASCERELLVIRDAFEAACMRGIHRIIRPVKANSAHGRLLVPPQRKEVTSRAPAV